MVEYKQTDEEPKWHILISVFYSPLKLSYFGQLLVKSIETKQQTICYFYKSAIPSHICACL